jgi:predicted acylesterase/phospholipase RssA
MNKIGLALSGGGFRASLYHLGLVRFLRDAGILSQVTHITSVSGGSIIAAHLVQNWDRYNGSPNEFDAAASELLSFVRLDVRNRITRRYPLYLPLRLPRRLAGRSNRKLTLSGLLEGHYEKFLYGDTSLFELPEKPQLHILATNLSEGCLCSFNRNGLLIVRRRPGRRFRIDHIHVGLATVSMAVAASSAFPGFFPPLELTGADVGANAGEFGRQAYTDGGVFDNLGVRMFRCLERPILADSPLGRDDFYDFHAVIEAMREASQTGQDTPLRRLAQVLMAAAGRADSMLNTDGGSLRGTGMQPVASTGPGGNLVEIPFSSRVWNGENENLVLSNLGKVMREYQFQFDPTFAGLTPDEPDADALLQASRRGGRILDEHEQLWLGRHLLETAFKQATGRDCFRRLNSGLDGVLVSDVGKRIEMQSNRRAGGLVRTSLRATDILMDRVWQLEIETFEDTTGFVFAPLTEVVDPSEDPTALHPEIQRQTAKIRTDLDCFSPLEISSLVRHGYCVGRKACRAHPALFGADLPRNEPWDPIPGARGAAPPVPATPRPGGPLTEPTASTVEARTLQASAFRRIWSTLLDYRDWTSYVYVPLVLPLLFLIPFLIVKYYERTHRLNQLVQSFAHGSGELEQMSLLLENGPVKPWTGVAAEEVGKLEEPDFKNFRILQDTRIVDLRAWKPGGDPSSRVYVYRRINVLKQSDDAGLEPFRIRLSANNPQTEVRFPRQRLQPKLLKSVFEPGQKRCHWEASFDLESVAAGDSVELFVEYMSPGESLRGNDAVTGLDFDIQVETAELIMWILMPKGEEISDLRYTRHQTGKPETTEPAKIVTRYMTEDATILAYKLLALEPGNTHEMSWSAK